MQAGVEGSVDVKTLLEADVKGEENLVVGELENGFRYPCSVSRCLAHLGVDLEVFAQICHSTKQAPSYSL